MTTPLPELPADYAPDETPTADEINAIKAHAAAHTEQLNTVLTKGLVTPIATNSTTTISWASVRNSRNGIGWSLSVPSRLTVPAGGDGLWNILAAVQFDAINNTGFRQVDLLRNNATALGGLAVPGSNAVYGALNVLWQLDMTAGEYVELRAWQNSGVSINVMVAGITPQIAMWREQS